MASGTFEVHYQSYDPDVHCFNNPMEENPAMLTCDFDGESTAMETYQDSSPGEQCICRAISNCHILIITVSYIVAAYHNYLYN